MHLKGEASRLIAVEINLESNSHHKQNYILLYQDESEKQCLLCGCPLSAAAATTTSLWAERQNSIWCELSNNLGVLKCLDEKFISVSHSFNEKCRKANTLKQTKYLLMFTRTRTKNVGNKSLTCYKCLKSS